MGSTEGVRQWLSEMFVKRDEEYIFKVVLIGDCVGKSSLLLRFHTDEFTEETNMQFIPMTLGLDVKSKTLEVDGPEGPVSVTLNIWDTAGQDRFRKLNEQYLPSAHAVIVLYDVRNPQTFKECRVFVDDVKQLCDKDAIRILVGNKNDVDDSKKIISSQRGFEYASSSGFRFMETSAKDNINVSELFHTVAKLCLEKKLQIDKSPS